MSIAVISYDSLADASGEASAVAQKLGKYSESLYNSVYNKLNKYDGDWTSNLSVASTRINNKISELNDEQIKYETYSSNLSNLINECITTDKAVKSKVSSLTASFKEAHGIRNSSIENAISNFFTSIGNGTVLGRWLGEAKDTCEAKMSYLKDSIKEWYNYGGGKELIKGVASAYLGYLIAALAIASVFITGGAALTVWAVVVKVATVVSSLIAISGCMYNSYNEYRAYSATQNGDPATGRRRSNINSVQDYLRSSFKYYDSDYYDPENENESYQKYYREEGKRNEFIATGIDTVKLACDTIQIADGASKLLKNGYKWIYGSNKDLKDITMGDISPKKMLGDFKNKIIDTGKSIKSSIMFSVKEFGNSSDKLGVLKGWGGQITSTGKQAIGNVAQNLKGEYFDFKNLDGTLNEKSALKSIKNMISIPKEFIDKGFNKSTLIDVGFDKFVKPGVTVFDVSSKDPIDTYIDEYGVEIEDFTENITVDDFWSIGEKGEKLLKNAKNAYFDESVVPKNVTKDVTKKFSSRSDVSTESPKYYCPSGDLGIVRV